MKHRRRVQEKCKLARRFVKYAKCVCTIRRAGKAGKLLHKLGKHIAATMKEHNPNHHHPNLGQHSSSQLSEAGSSGHGHPDGRGGLDELDSVRLATVNCADLHT